MRFEEVLPALREGKKIRRKTFILGTYICLEDNVLKVFISYLNRRSGGITLMTRDLLADDWEIVKETRKVKLRDLTEEQCENWCNGHCHLYKECKDCAFGKVNCLTSNKPLCWVNNKDLYSDKFLDQEIEIEEE